MTFSELAAFALIAVFFGLLAFESFARANGMEDER